MEFFTLEGRFKFYHYYQLPFLKHFWNHDLLSFLFFLLDPLEILVNDATEMARSPSLSIKALSSTFIISTWIYALPSNWRLHKPRDLICPQLLLSLISLALKIEEMHAHLDVIIVKTLSLSFPFYPNPWHGRWRPLYLEGVCYHLHYGHKKGNLRKLPHWPKNPR